MTCALPISLVPGFQKYRDNNGLKSASVCRLGQQGSCIKKQTVYINDVHDESTRRANFCRINYSSNSGNGSLLAPGGSACLNITRGSSGEVELFKSHPISITVNSQTFEDQAAPGRWKTYLFLSLVALLSGLSASRYAYRRLLSSD